MADTKLEITLTWRSALNNWVDMNRALKYFGEEDIRKMLDHEISKKGRRRPDFVRRIHQRLGKLQHQREAAVLELAIKGDI